MIIKVKKINSTFDIFDINNDGIPELFILSGNQCTICSIFNGELIRTDKKYMEYGMCSLSKKFSVHLQ